MRSVDATGHRIVNLAILDKVDWSETDAWDVNLPSHGWKRRLMEYALALLKRWKWIKPCMERKVGFDTITIDTKDIAELVFEQLNQLARHNLTPTKIYIGHKQMADLRINNVHDPYALNIDLTTLRPKMYGIGLVLHPFMDGVLVVSE